MNAILAIPIELRLLILFVLGSLLGALLNLGIYRLAFAQRAISPWTLGIEHRGWLDRLPIIGWWSLRRERAQHGAGFWIRPMMIEIVTGVGLAALYWWEVHHRGLLPAGIIRPGPLDPPLPAWLHLQFVSHVLLIALMMLASLIDIDEKLIPDTITITGTVLGLLLAATMPWSLLPDPIPSRPWPNFDLKFLTFLSPHEWPQAWGDRQFWQLSLGLGCYWLWCLGLLPRPWYTRHGYARALRVLSARVYREPFSWWILLLSLVGAAAIGLVWRRGGVGWQALLSTLVGMVVGGGMIWLVRIVAKAALKKEAMGFGDVTLMAMIGSFLGWQPCVIIFFLAPAAGLLVGLIQWFVRRDNEIPYGPFLCLAALFTIVFWAFIWERTWLIFSLGWMLAAVMLVCLVLMGVMLAAWRALAKRFFGAYAHG